MAQMEMTRTHAQASSGFRYRQSNTYEEAPTIKLQDRQRGKEALRLQKLLHAVAEIICWLNHQALRKELEKLKQEKIYSKEQDKLSKKDFDEFKILDDVFKNASSLREQQKIWSKELDHCHFEILEMLFLESTMKTGLAKFKSELRQRDLLDSFELFEHFFNTNQQKWMSENSVTNGVQHSQEQSATELESATTGSQQTTSTRKMESPTFQPPQYELSVSSIISVAEIPREKNVNRSSNERENSNSNESGDAYAGSPTQEPTKQGTSSNTKTDNTGPTFSVRKEEFPPEEETPEEHTIVFSSRFLKPEEKNKLEAGETEMNNEGAVGGKGENEEMEVFGRDKQEGSSYTTITLSDAEDFSSKGNDKKRGMKYYMTAGNSFPPFITIMCVLQVGIYYASWSGTYFYLIFHPHRRLEVWRFFTPCLIHCRNESSDADLWVHIAIQFALACVVEKRLGTWRTVVVYIGSTLFGTLFTSVVYPWGFQIGASNAIVGTFMSLVPYSILTYDKGYHKLSGIRIVVCVIVFLLFETMPCLVSGVPFDIGNLDLGGAIGGMLLGLVVYFEPKPRDWRFCLKVVAFSIIALLLVCGVGANMYYASSSDGLPDKSRQWSANVADPRYILAYCNV